MEVSRTLGPTEPYPVGTVATACPRCDEPESGLQPVRAQALDGASLLRCHRCGTRSVLEAGRQRFVFTCSGCGLPFLADEILPHAEQRCGDCGAGKLPPEIPDSELTEAMEEEARAALALRWSFVTASTLSVYLQRLVHQIEPHIPNAPSGCRVILMDDWSHRTLALPSGLILISLGTLAFLEDEAELVFVLAHEIAHAASSDASVRLVRLGYQAAASERKVSSDEAWIETVLDLVRLGYGRVRERDADAVALDVVLSLGYATVSVNRYFARLQERVQGGASEVAELASAHPPADDRSRRLDRALFGRVHEETVPKTNREVFRRAAGHHILAGELVPADLDPARIEDHGSSSEEVSGRGRLFWLVAGIAAVATIILAVGYILTN